IVRRNLRPDRMLGVVDWVLDLHYVFGMKSTGIAQARLKVIEQELHLIEGTILALPTGQHSDLLEKRLIDRVGLLQDELMTIYKNHNFVRFQQWRRKLTHQNQVS